MRWGTGVVALAGLALASTQLTCARSAAPSRTEARRSALGASLGNIKAIVAGQYVTCAVLTDGTVKCWGYGAGPLGVANGNDTATPVAVPGLSGAVDVGVGSGYACALMGDGTVACWGTTSDGQLGVAASFTTPNPRFIGGLAGVTALAVGWRHACALTSDAMVRCWGDDQFGQLGDGGAATSASVPITVAGVSGVVSLSAGANHTCALLGDGTARCWGANNGTQLGSTDTTATGPIEVTSLGGGTTAMVSIEAGVDHTCAVLVDGTGTCWGADNFDQLGDGVPRASSPPAIVVGLTGIVEISAGDAQTCAALADGTARCWGRNDKGQVGNGGLGTAIIPSAVSGLSNVASISAGIGHTCARLKDGTARCWGDNTFGQLGSGGVMGSRTPATFTLPFGVSALAAGGRHTCALMQAGGVRCWGTNDFGQLGDGSIQSSATPTFVAGLAGVAGLAAGNQHSCALLSDGTVHCWGSNVNGQLGGGVGFDSQTPVVVIDLGGVASLGAGATASHQCAVLSGVNGGPARCWGADSDGELGDGSTALAVTSNVVVTGLATASAISEGFAHTCALLADGTVKCWGANGFGQLGGAGASSPVPVSVPGLAGVVALSAGLQHTCALLGDGTVQCWGYCLHGECGNGLTGTLTSTPVAVVGLSGVVSVAAGGSQTCAILADATVRCWGSNVFGQLGNGGNGEAHTPVPVTGLVGAVSLAAGNLHTCAVMIDGSPRCWGDNRYLQIGGPRDAFTTAPVAVARSGIGAVCSSDVDCESNACADGVCCDVACGGNDPDDCQACSVTAGAPTDGTCAPVPGAHVCRASAGPCDPAETCDGVSPACPSDALAPATTECRPSHGVCDVAERCDGVGVDCADDALAPPGTPCRAAVPGGCDVAEACTGASAACPPDAFTAAGTTCHAAQSGCDTTVKCSGGDATCVVPPLPSPDVCTSVPPGAPIVNLDKGDTVVGGLTFFYDNVKTAGGAIQIAQSQGGLPPPPANFKIVTGDDPDASLVSTFAWDFVNTAPFTGNVTICVKYPQAYAAYASSMTFMHYDVNTTCLDVHNATTSWCPLTLSGRTDASKDLFCGVTTSFSPFALMVPIATPPVLTVPGPIVAEATGPAGATVTYAATATDALDGALTPTCLPASGSTFPLGATTVSCQVTDSSGLTTPATFTVAVRDTTAPVVTGLPASPLVSGATSTAGARVTWVSPKASDLVDGARAVTCAPASGATFAPGKTTVSCSASDTRGNTSPPSTFTVWVQYQAPTDGTFFLAPIHADGSSIFAIGRPVPVRFRLTGASAGITNLVAKLVVTKISNAIQGTTTDTSDETDDDTGLTFIYRPALKLYAYRWKTRDQTQGTYQLRADLGDGVTHQINVSLRSGR